jgi:23S rRNA-/tRNA-specific pseudouridylate synthase
VHLAEDGHPILGDDLYGPSGETSIDQGLRAAALAYLDPFSRARVRIRAPVEAFAKEYGFDIPELSARLWE